MRHPLSDNYRVEREELLALGRALDAGAASAMTTACPEWSIKDVYAHLAGISTDIIAGNTENAATVEWADGHVADRLNHSFGDILDEWEAAGTEVSQVMEVAGTAFPFQLFVDQWTHGWDIRATLGEPASAVPDLSVYEHYLPDFFSIMRSDVEVLNTNLGELVLSIEAATVALGEGPNVGTLELSLFEFARVSMGRRSEPQLRALPWPDGVVDPAPYIDLLVRWSVNDRDVNDPAVRSS